MTLDRWILKNIAWPSIFLIASLVLLWTGLLFQQVDLLNDKRTDLVQRTSRVLSIALQQNNRVLIEILIESLVSYHGARSSELCSGDLSMRTLALGSGGCKKIENFFVSTKVQTIPGFKDAQLVVQFSRFSGFEVLVWYLILVLALFIFLFFLARQVSAKLKMNLVEPLAIGLVGRDPLPILELEKLRLMVQEANDLEAETKLNAAVKMSIRRMAHDIRGPTQALGALLASLNLPDLRFRRAIEKILERIREVADDVLFESKSESPRPEDFRCSLKQLLLDVIEEKALVFSDFQFRVDCAVEEEVTLSLQRQFLARIVSNLVDNGIQASQTVKEIQVACRFLRSEVIISIADFGRGMSEETLKKVGEEGFSYRVSGQEAGHGLGVSSAKRQLETVGGKIEYDSQPGKGTRVHLTVPTSSIHEEQTLRAVLIDDDDLQRMTWEMVFRSKGMDLRHFFSPGEFFDVQEKIDRNTPVFIDYCLGRNSNAQMYVGEIRSLGFKKIFIVSGYSDLHSSKIEGVMKILGKSPIEALSFV